jgi:tRNA G18 (ribose-2'-O)-methylase SpoU
MKKSHQKTILILEDIRSAHNIGALFRTADAVGIEHIILVGQSATPLDRFGKKRPDIGKAALGAEETVSWEYKKTITPVMNKLEKDGYVTIAIEQDSKSIDYKKVKIKTPVVFILGNEVTGVSKKILNRVNTIAEIPMKGQKESLNVSVAGGVALFRILNR